MEARARLALWLLFAVAALQRVWNAWTVRPLNGFDAPGHMGYVLTIVREHRLPHPLDGWSTFHPPLYYLLASGIWGLLEPLGPHAVLFGIRMLGALLGLALALVTLQLVRRLGASRDVAFVTTALALFVPCIQLSATMEGNESFAAGVAALGLPSLLALQADPRNVRAALVTGVFAGLAAISKFTGLALVAAAVVPFVRVDLDRAMARGLLALGIAFAVIALPVYGRNVATVGSPFPMTRTREPMHSAENSQVIRPRQLLDYVTVHLDCFRRPSIFQVAGRPGTFNNRNTAMTSVPGLMYASFWYDPTAHRIPIYDHHDGIRSGPLMISLGVGADPPDAGGIRGRRCANRAPAPPRRGGAARRDGVGGARDARAAYVDRAVHGVGEGPVPAAARARGGGLLRAGHDAAPGPSANGGAGARAGRGDGGGGRVHGGCGLPQRGGGGW
jgi:hypothetical protein